MHLFLPPAHDSRWNRRERSNTLARRDISGWREGLRLYVVSKMKTNEQGRAKNETSQVKDKEKRKGTHEKKAKKQDNEATTIEKVWNT